jgi:hypothetical protein
LTAKINASAKMGLGGDLIDLDGSGSTATDSVITTYAWTQISGPIGIMTGSNSSNAIFEIPPISEPQAIELQLEVTNADGKYDRQSVIIHAFESVDDVKVLHIVGQPGEFVTGGREYLLSSADIAFAVQNTGENIVSAEADALRPDQIRLRAIMAAPDNNALAVGAYENAARHPFEDPGIPGLNVSGIGRSCNTSLGRFDVLEISFDTSGALVSAAIDFEQACTDALGVPQAKLTGSLRFGTLLDY